MDKDDFIREKYPDMRPDELQWEPPDVDEQELMEWKRKKFEEKQEELKKRILDKIDFSKNQDVYRPQWAE